MDSELIQIAWSDNDGSIIVRKDGDNQVSISSTTRQRGSIGQWISFKTTSGCVEEDITYLYVIYHAEQSLVHTDNTDVTTNSLNIYTDSFTLEIPKVIRRNQSDSSIRVEQNIKI